MPVSEPSDVPPFTITLFGPMQAQVDGAPMPHLRSRKALWLLALLTLRAQRPVEREWLAAMLWPDLDPSRGFANLRPILSELRNRLGSQRVRLQTPNRLTLLLDLKGVHVDLLIFDAAIKSKRLSALEQAVELYRGPLMEGCNEEWVFPERAMREQSCLQALQTLADTALATGDSLRAIGYYQRMVAMDPFADSPRRGWMEALAREGDRNAALQVYRDFVAALKIDPTAAPDEQTNALYARLRAEARKQNRKPAATSGQATAHPKITGYLPHPLTELVGREDERQEVLSRLQRSRLVTLTGLGGIGKTRLAIEVAHEVVERYADGVWLVALEALTEESRILPQIASVLGLREESAPPLLQRVTEHLSPKRILLVLDNCEHLLKGTAQCVGHLLRECAEVGILVTSREALGITGEIAWPVPALPVPDLAHLPQGHATLLRVLLSYEGVQLFAERGQAIQKTFALNGSNALPVAQICASLEGIPLAIELAAARVKSMTVEQIAVRLEDHLGLLTGGSRTAMSRQQTLRATLDWSYELLTESERVLLRRLSVFAGGWTLEAAERVVAGETIEDREVCDLLAALVDKSLVLFEEEPDAGGRYRLLEMVRQYAAERLRSSGETDRMRLRHRQWCVELAEEADTRLDSAEQGRWLHRLDAEQENLRSTLNTILSEPDGDESELRLVGALWQFWERRGHFSEGRQRLHRALERAREPSETAARAKALTGAAAMAYRQGDFAEARSLHQQSLNLFRSQGNRRGMAAALTNQGSVAWAQGDYRAAQALLAESLSLQKELGNSVSIAVTLRALGQLAVWQDEYATGRAYFEESLARCRQAGDQHGVAFVLDDIGHIDLLQGDYPTARTRYAKSLGIRRELGDRYGIAMALSNLGAESMVTGDAETARACTEEALAIFTELGDQQGIAHLRLNLGVLAQDQGDLEQAQTSLEEGVALFRRVGDHKGMAGALCSLGIVVVEAGDLSYARTLLVESLTMQQALGSRSGVAESLDGLAALKFALTEMQSAVRLWGAAQSIREAIGTVRLLNERKRYDRHIEQARTALGEDEFAAAWESGLTLTWEQATTHVLMEA